MINSLGSMIQENKLIITNDMKTYALSKLSALRAEIVFDFVKAI